MFSALLPCSSAVARRVEILRTQAVCDATRPMAIASHFITWHRAFSRADFKHLGLVPGGFSLFLGCGSWLLARCSSCTRNERPYPTPLFSWNILIFYSMCFLDIFDAVLCQLQQQQYKPAMGRPSIRCIVLVCILCASCYHRQAFFFFFSLYPEGDIAGNKREKHVSRLALVALCLYCVCVTRYVLGPEC